jgi:hypothetical protein
MTYQSDKHGPRQDDELAHEVRGQVQSGQRTRAEEWRDTQPQYPAEDQPDVDRFIVPDDRRGNPVGMETADVEMRSELARFLGRHVYPADREQLVQVAAENQAPDVVIQALASLPAGLKFANVADVASELGLAQERRRA